MDPVHGENTVHVQTRSYAVRVRSIIDDDDVGGWPAGREERDQRLLEEEPVSSVGDEEWCVFGDMVCWRGVPGRDGWEFCGRFELGRIGEVVFKGVGIWGGVESFLGGLRAPVWSSGRGVVEVWVDPGGWTGADCGRGEGGVVGGE